MKRIWRLYWPCYLLAQLFLARWVRIDFYDALVNLRNARALADGALDYTTYRPPLLPLLHAPLQLALNAAGAGPNVLLWAPHLFEVLLSMACLAAVYLYLKRFLPEDWAEAGTILFSLDRLVIHYFFATMADIPSLLFLILFFLLAEKRDAKSRALCAGALAASLLCRWNLLVVPAGLVLCAPLAREGKRRRELWGVAVASLGIFLAVNALAYGLALKLGPVGSMRLLAHTMRSQLAQVSGREWPLAYFASLFSGAGPALCALFLAGAAFAFLDKKKNLAAQAGVFLSFFLIMTVAIGHKESRYLFPVLPAFYLVALYGLKRVYETARQTALLAAVAAVSVLGAGRELARFADPAYRDPVLFDSARLVVANKGPAARVYWYGFAHSIVLRDPVFARGDPFYYLYHVPSPESLEYMTGLKVWPLERQTEPRPGDLVVRAPVRPWLLDEPLRPGEDGLWLWRVEAGRKLALITRLD